MNTVKEVLKEMRSLPTWGGYPDATFVCWADAIEAAMREKNAEIEQLRAFFEAVSERSDEQRHIEASAEIEKLREICDDLYSESQQMKALLAEVAASMQVSPLRMELRGRIRAALNTEVPHE